MEIGNITSILAAKLKELKESQKDGKISFEDVTGMVVSVIESVNSNFIEGSMIYKELEEIKNAIENAKSETVTVLNDDDETIPDASLQLDEVIKHSEEAANTIIDNASEIMELAGDNEKVNELAMGIIEKCDFGDLSRQRLIKVVAHLDNIENRLNKLFETLKIETRMEKPKKESDGPEKSGPQLSGEAPSQDDIDALFDSL